MPGISLYPGQSKRAVFTLDQVKALTSAIRSEVFWAFNPNEPLSAAEVASALAKSAQTVHYHVHELVGAGLLIGVETRKKRARTETLYVHSSLDFVGQGPKAPKEYREHIRDGFAAITRAMVREEEALHRVFDADDASIAQFSAYRRASVRLSPERAAYFKQRLYEVLTEMEAQAEDPQGIRVNAAVFMKPTQAESRQWLERLKGRKPKA
jgi:predicted ArsR family transcriptional regulator